MSSPHGHTHGSSSPATLASQPHGYQQQYSQQPEGGYDSGLMPTNDYFGKEVVDPNTQHQQAAQGYAPIYQQQQPQHQAPAAPADKRICGVRRTTFLLALLAAVLLAGVIGAAAAAGIVASKVNSGNTTSPVSSGTPSETPSTTNSESPSTTGTPAAASFTAIPLPEEPTGLGVTRPLCPSVNNTKTEIPGTDLVFKHECGINYPGYDLGNIPMTSMADCLLQCAAQNVRPQGAAGPCQGVSWVYGKRQGVDGEACYLKYAKGTPFYDNEKLESAFLVDS